MRHPGDQLLGTVTVREPGHEPRAVQIRIHLRLKINLGPFGHEPERIVERHVVVHHGAEDHLVGTRRGTVVLAAHPYDVARKFD